MIPSPRSSSRLISGPSLLGAALLLGALARFWVPVTGGFVAMDGGMFLVASQEISRHHMLLPATLPYPASSPTIPFCYPPLAFYLAALLRLFGVPILFSLRFLPPLFSTLTIWGVWRLARQLFVRERDAPIMAGVAALFWALTPGSFQWMVMGGGLTRAPAFLLALLAVERGIHFWRDGDSKSWWHATLLLAVTLATHLERARFLVIALLLVWLIYNRTVRGFGALTACYFGGALLCAPWWGLCLARFGLAPFRSAYHSGSSDWMGAYAGQFGVGLGGESLFPILVCLAMGGFFLLRRRVPLLWVWYLVIWALELRSGIAFISLPIALAASAFVVSAPQTLRRALFVGATGWLILQASLSAQNLRVLSPASRDAMAWCALNSPPSARFFVVPANSEPIWATDLEGEWFPALAQRTAPLTVQGAEWLPTGVFGLQQRHHTKIFKLRSWAQVQADLAAFGTRPDWIFWPRSKRLGTRRHLLQDQLLADTHWHLAFQNEDVLVFQQQRR